MKLVRKVDVRTGRYVSDQVKPTKKANVKPTNTLDRSTVVAAKKASVKSRNLLTRPIEISMLRPFIPRPIAADFAVCSRKTLIRAEQKGQLIPIRRGDQSVCYERSAFLKFLGIKI
jgi:hypothetical protein